MGNDSGVRRKHKQRTVQHNKHGVFPGMRVAEGLFIERGVIKVPKPDKEPFVYKPAVKIESAPLWARVDAAVKKLNDFQIQNKGSSPLATRMNIEREYGIAYRELVRVGQAAPVRKKYLLR